jgi:hypothetical protein
MVIIWIVNKKGRRGLWNSPFGAKENPLLENGKVLEGFVPGSSG